MRKNFLTAFACLLLSLTGSAQQKVYCELISVWGLRNTKMIVDFGTRDFNGRWREHIIVDEDGEEIIFKSSMDALNYMSVAGWSLEEVYEHIDDGNGRTCWVLGRYLKEGENIEDGVMTAASCRMDAMSGMWKMTIRRMSAG